MDWLQFVRNRLSIESLYTEPLDLSRIHVLTCKAQHRIPSEYNAINIGFRITRLPDKIPQHGIWIGLENIVGVYMLFSFGIVENLSSFDVPMGQYDLSINKNVNYVKKISLIDGNPKWQALDTVDRIPCRIEKRIFSSLVFCLWNLYLQYPAVSPRG